MSRFYKSDIINPISTYAPAPLKYIDEAGAFNQLNTDAQLSGLSETQRLLNLQGGYSTTDLAKQTAAKYEPEIAALNEEIATKGNISGGAAKILALRNRISSDPDVQSILSDQAYKTKVDADMSTQGFQNNVQGFYDPKNNLFKQRGSGDKFNTSWYNSVSPGNPQKEFKPYYDQLEDVIKQEYDGELSEQVNSDGSISIIQNGIKTNRSVSKDELREISRGLLENDPNFSTLQSFNYGKARAEQAGQSWDNNDNSDIFVNNYLKNKNDKVAIQNIKGTRKPGVSDNGGSGNTNSPYNMDNIYGDILDNIYTDKVKKGEDGKPVLTTGTTSVNEKQMSALIGGEIKNGDVITSLTGRRVYLTTPEQVVREGKSIIDNRKAVEFQAELNLMQKAIINRLDNPESPELATGYIDPKNNNRYYRDAAGNIKEQKSGDIKSKTISEKQFAETQNEYKSIKLKAIAQGIDLDNPKTIEAIKNSTKEDEVVTTFNQALAEGALNGEFKLVPAKDGDNVITDKEGNMYGRNYVEMSKEQISNISPDNFLTTGGGYETLLEKGIIKKSWTKNADGSSTLMYQVPVTIQSDDNTDNITRNSQLSIYKDDDKTQASINTLQQVNANKQNYYKGLTQSKNIESALNNKKYSSSDLIKDLSEVEDSSGLIKTVLDRINDLKDDKSKNKELSDLWLMINNHPAWIEKHKEDGVTADVGKSQEDWVQTPANPLKK